MRLRSRIALIFFPLFWAALAVAAPPQQVAAVSAASAPPAIAAPPCRVIVAGFRGAIEDPNDRGSGVVAIRDRLRSLGHADLCARVFSPYHQGRALKWILAQFHLDLSTGPSEAELAREPKVILYGYSLGGWAMMAVARHLGKENVPVQLGVVVDGMWPASKTVPPNVLEAANFYQRKSWLMKGRDRIRAQDSELTQILVNERLYGPGHFSIDLAPQVSDFVVAKAESFYAPE
jgi:hypothetical protein